VNIEIVIVTASNDHYDQVVNYHHDTVIRTDLYAKLCLNVNDPFLVSRMKNNFGRNYEG
jgi:hypothetical protein